MSLTKMSMALLGGRNARSSILLPRPSSMKEPAAPRRIVASPEPGSGPPARVRRAPPPGPVGQRYGGGRAAPDLLIPGPGVEAPGLRVGERLPRRGDVDAAQE